MHKVIAYCFIPFYFLLSIGITADIHFCNGEIHSVSVSKMPLKSCCGIREKNCGCCKNVNIAFQKTSDEKVSYTDKIQFSSIVYVSIYSPVIEGSKSFTIREINKPQHFFPPPNSSYPSINIRNCTFII